MRVPRTSRLPRALLPATALCLAALLSACGNADGRGHAAVGAAGPADGRSPTRPVPPHDGITLTPLDGDGTPTTANGSPSYASPPPPGSGTSTTPGSGAAPPAESRNHATGSDSGTAPGNDTDNGRHRGSDRESASSPGSPSGGSPTSPSGKPTAEPPHRPPAKPPTPIPDPKPSPTPTPEPSTPPHLTTGPVNRTGTDVRWCENVSLTLRNTGDRPVTSGTVSFGTHIIGALGIDWATRTSTHPLPTPITGHTHRTATWRVCVSAWRVPLGMHIETRDVRIDWH